VPKLKNPSSELDGFLGAQNGIRFRLRACADYSEAFTQSVQNFGDAPPVIERYRQEAFLFDFFVSGFAALDSFSFFMYLAAAQIQPPISQPRSQVSSSESTARPRLKRLPRHFQRGHYNSTKNLHH